MTFWSPVRIRFSVPLLSGMVIVRMFSTSITCTRPIGEGQEKPMPGCIVPL